MKTLFFGTLILAAAAATPAAALPLDRWNGPELWAVALKHSTGVCNRQGYCWRTGGRVRGYGGRPHVVYHEYYVDYGETSYVRR